MLIILSIRCTYSIPLCNLFLKHILLQWCPDLNFKCKYNCLASYQLIFLSHLDWGVPVFSMENLYKLHATQNYLISKENNWGFQHKLPGVIERTNSNHWLWKYQKNKKEEKPEPAMQIYLKREVPWCQDTNCSIWE